jgi:PKHD-type hydroxylase
MDYKEPRPYFYAPSAMATMSELNIAARYPYVALPAAFTPAELDAIEALGDGLSGSDALTTVNDGKNTVNRNRITQVGWMHRTAASEWLYERIERLARQLNAQAFQYDLRGFTDNFQYAVYHGNSGGHYDWHIDMIPHPRGDRKMSLSLQLSDPSQYQGCDLQFIAGGGIETAPRDRGALIAFPSYITHRVTPATAGTRKSLVVWVGGPKFR